MKLRLNGLALFTVGVATTGLIACGPKDKGGEKLDHETARQAITGNTEAMAANVSTSIKFLDRSDLFNMGVDRTIGYGGGTACSAPVGPDGESGDVDCVDSEGDISVDLDLDLNDDAELVIRELENRILTDANVEAETETSVTYLLRGDVVCAEEGAPADPECADSVDDAEIRIVVSSPAEGEVDFDVQVGPDRANPLSGQIHSDLLAVEVDLGGIKASAAHLESVTGDQLDLPNTFEGRLRAELEAPADNQIRAAFGLLKNVNVADGDFSVSAEATMPAYAVTVDGGAETVNVESNLGAIDGLFPVTNYEYDSATDTETETTYDLGFHIAPSTANALFDAASELLTLTDVGSTGTSTFSVDGEEIVSVDLNGGDTFDATISSNGPDTVDVEVSPKFDLAVALQLAKAADVLSDVDEWTLDEVLTITLDGAQKPALRFHDDTEQIEVLDGTLEVALQNEGTTVTASAGQCLLTLDPAPTPDEPTEEPVEEAWTPLTDLMVDSCQ